MGAIFHFYNSEDEDDDINTSRSRTSKKLTKEQQVWVKLLMNHECEFLVCQFVC